MIPTVLTLVAQLLMAAPELIKDVEAIIAAIKGQPTPDASPVATQVIAAMAPAEDALLKAIQAERARG